MEISNTIRKKEEMKSKLVGKTALVTGSSSGIGRAVALRYAQEGADVIITSSERSVDQGKEVAKLATEYGVKSVYIQADLKKAEEINGLFDRIKEIFGHIDILVNNAGTQRGGNINSISLEEFDEEMRVNTYALVQCTQRAKALMRDKGWVINTSSIRGLDYAGRSPIMGYCATKAAVNSLTKTMAIDLAPNIFVNAVMPGFVYTENYDNYDEKLKRSFIDNTPIKRFIKPEEIAEVYVFLASTEILTGSIIIADGGASLLNR